MANFSEWANVAEEISKVSSKLEKVTLLSGFLKRLSDKDLHFSSIYFTGNAFSQKDERKLNLAKGIVRDALIIITGLTKEEYDVEYLKFSEPGEVAEFLLQTKNTNGDIKVERLGEFFNDLRDISSNKQKATLLANLFRILSPVNAKYVTKIVVGDLRIGLKEALVEDAIAEAFFLGERKAEGKDSQQFRKFLKDVKWANMLTGDIGEVAILAKDNKLSEAQMTLFHPFKSMLATAEATIGDVMKRTKGNRWAADDKYDGIRAHVHKEGQKIRIFSRDLNDITSQFPDIVDYMSKQDGDFIFDGEIVAMRDGKIQPFFLLQQRLGRKVVDKELLEKAPAEYVIYDFLYDNGEVLLNHPYEDRRKRIEDFRFIDSHLHSSKLVWFEREEELSKAFKDSKERGNEGLLIKNPKSLYKPGKRGVSWLKYKETLEPIDVVVTGVEFGHGKRRNDLSDYTFSIWDKKRKNLVTLGKVYSGVTDEDVAILTKHFKNTTLEDTGRFRTVKPEVVFEIQYESIQKSDRHESGFALRFPRVKKIRVGDKGVGDIDDLKRVEEIWEKFMR